MRSNEEFLELNGINQKFSRDKEEYCILIKNLVETKKNIVYPLVYLLIKLSLILPISLFSCKWVIDSIDYKFTTETMERDFFAMKFYKEPIA